MAQNIEVIARGLCVESDAVLVCVNKKQGYGYLPGGHVDFGESASDALAREFLEECGEAVEVGSPMLGMELAFHQRGKKRHELSLMFPVKRLCLDSAVQSFEADIAFEWWLVNSLANRDLRPHQLRNWLCNAIPIVFSSPTTMRWVSACRSSHNP